MRSRYRPVDGTRRLVVKEDEILWGKIAVGPECCTLGGIGFRAKVDDCHILCCEEMHCSGSAGAIVEPYAHGHFLTGCESGIACRLNHKPAVVSAVCISDKFTILPGHGEAW